MISQQMLANLLISGFIVQPLNSPATPYVYERGDVLTMLTS
jgi:hypothetical protein